MSSSADIITETKYNTLVVPIQSVAVRTPQQLENKTTESDSTESKNYTADKDGFVQVVFVLTSDIVNAVQVKTGIQSETHIEITEGLSEGDEIVTGNYRAISQLLGNNSQVRVQNEEQQALAGN